MAILKKLCFDSSCSDLPFSDYYTKQEVQELIHDLEGLTVVIVDQLPATGEANTMYFVPNGSVYDEYMYISGAWEALGSTDVDLSNYVTTATHTADIGAIQAVDSTQNGKIATLENDVDDIETALTNKQDKLTAGSNISISGNTISANLSGYVPTTTYNTAINSINDKDTAQDTDIAALQTGKQDKLTAGTNVQISGNTINATDTTYTAGNGLSLSGTTFSAKTGYSTSGNNRAVLTDASGNLYTIQKDTTYSAGSYISINSSNQISVNLTKANLLSILGYKEATLAVTATDGTTTTKTILVKQ